MRRIVGIVILVIGVLLLLAHFVMKVQEIGLGFSISTIIIGAAVLGLSFVPQPVAGPDAPPVLPPAERVTRVFYEPEPVFKNLRYHPRWLAAFIVVRPPRPVIPHRRARAQRPTSPDLASRGRESTTPRPVA